VSGNQASARPDLNTVLTQGPAERSEALARRVETVLDTLGCPSPASTGRALLTALDRAIAGGGLGAAWLALAVLTGELPLSSDVRRLARASQLDGALPALLTALDDSGWLTATAWPEVEVVTGQVLVDVHDTAQNLVATGIQRVARQAARRWQQHHDFTFIGWSDGFTGYRRLSVGETSRAVHGVETGPTGSDRSGPSVPASDGVLVPWKCTHLVPELPAVLQQARRYQAFARFSGSATGLIGFDCVPVMAAETTIEGMSLGFANYLTAAAHVDRIAAISSAAELEYRGWRTMLAGTGLGGPDICSIPLPVQADTPSDAALRQVGDLLGIGSLPIVLTVGSHEPRKNHLAVLHAAELLWREGLLFTLVFVGGHSWNSGAFDAQLDALRRAGRPVQTIRALPDDLLWAAYRQAYCTVFASLHEGYGLPAAESLASGTPVITSNFGSMAELAGHGGALLIDPRQDRQLTDALRQLLLDRPLRDRLAAEAAAVPVRSWDDYARDTWNYLVHGTPPRAHA
jgi:glycosyltransferase involved in cell wall biosynthesis